jgi:TPR repeat protein
MMAIVLSALMQVVPAHALEVCPEHLRGLREMALALEHGEGVAKDPQRALALYCEAARLGDAEAQYSIGWMVANGRGVERDDALAAYFFELAANQGHPQARKMLRFVDGDKAAPPKCMAELEIAEPPEARDLLLAIAPGDVMAEVLSPHDIQDLLVESSPRQKKVAELVTKLAPRYGVAPRLAMAVIQAESNFNPQAVSPKNAQGLMQLIPETAERFNVRKPFDAEQNIRGGLAYLRWLLAYFKGNVSLVAAAYNAGEGTVNRYRGVPPFPETRDYVRRIKELFHWDEHPFDPAVTEPSPELARMRLVMK